MRPDVLLQLQRVAIFGGTFIAGAYLGWAVTKKKYLTQAENDVAEARAFYEHKFEQRIETELEGRLEEGDTTEQDLAAVEELTSDYGTNVAARVDVPHTTYNRPVQTVKVVTATPIIEVASAVEDETANLEWDNETEVGQRFREVPYVIHYDEFHNSTYTGNTQVTYTYYEEDNTLVDEGGSVITDLYAIIGMDTLQFGHGSKDKNVVYVRNEVIGMEFEITLERASYAKTVLGYEDEPELKHSYSRRGRRSRDDD